jgi:hypothetical protein
MSDGIREAVRHAMANGVSWPIAIAVCLLVGTAALFVWTWILYPLWMTRGSNAATSHPSQGAAAPLAEPAPCSIIIATRESPSALLPRIANIVRTTSPSLLGEIIVAVDVASPFPLSEYAAAFGNSAVVIAGDAPGGKAAGLNAGARRARFDTLVLADTFQRYVEGAIDALVLPLADPAVGGVSGTVRQESGDAAIDRYWRMDTRIRQRQAALHSVVTTTGQIAAFRKALYPVLPAGLICDDLYATAMVVMGGHRVAFSAGAVALDNRTFTRSQTLQRKMRTLTGLVQTCRLSPRIMSPLHNPIWLHFHSQKTLRLLSPVLLAIGGWATLFLVATTLGWPAPAIVALLAFVPLLVVFMSADTAARLLGPASFLWVPLAALWNGVRGRFNVWDQHASKRAATPSSTPVAR